MYENTASGLQVKPKPDSANRIIEFARIIHTLAGDGPDCGKLIIASFGEDPKTGKSISPKVRHVEIGDVDGMVNAIRSLTTDQHRNVYAPLAVMRKDITIGDKGREADVVGVFGLVADFDDDNAGNYAARLPLDPSLVLETSPGRFQAFIFFDRLLPISEAKPLAQRLKTAACCDHGTADCSHVWRIPGTLNWPNKKKFDQGRSAEPWTVRIEVPFDGVLISADDLEQALPPILIPEPKKNGCGTNHFVDDGKLPKSLIDRMAQSFPVGQRSEPAHGILCTLVELDWSDNDIVKKVYEFPNGVGSRYLHDEKKLQRDIAYARSKAKGKHQEYQHNGHSHSTKTKNDTGNSKQQAETRTDQNAGDWPEPVPLKPSVPPAPPFPRDCLPTKIMAMIEDEADRMQSPPDLLAIPTLITLAGCIGKDAALRPKALDDWAERPCLWAMIIGVKGMMKSPAINFATAPLRRLQKLSSDEHTQKKLEWLELKGEAELRLKAWEKECAERMKRGDGGYDADLPPKPRAYDDLPDEPVPERFITQDVTVERVMEIMKTSRGLTLTRDELAGFMLNMSRYTAGSDRQFYLECYSGGTYTSDRIGRGETTVADLYMNIVGGIQPSVARKLFSIEDSSDDGFFERFGLMAYPDLPDSWELVDRHPNANLRSSYHNICETLSKTDWAKVLHTDAEVEAGRAKPYARFSPSAQELFNDWLIEHMRTIRSASESQIEGFLNKQRGLLVRLALVIHLTSYAAGEETDPRAVSDRSLARALRLVEEYLVPTWRRVLAAFGKTQVESASIRIARTIIAERLSGIRISDIIKRDWSGMRDREGVEAAFDDLVARDWLEAPERKTGPRGGRPSETYRVNPRVFQMRIDSHE